MQCIVTVPGIVANVITVKIKVRCEYDVEDAMYRDGAGYWSQHHHRQDQCDEYDVEDAMYRDSPGYWSQHHHRQDQSEM